MSPSVFDEATTSDFFPAIHMAFDCMAIGVGLFASVMATWEPNERFTYGYVLVQNTFCCSCPEICFAGTVASRRYPALPMASS